MIENYFLQSLHAEAEGKVESLNRNVDLSIFVYSPPCRKCKYWNPKINIAFHIERERFIFEGITLCHTDEMQHDFSCFNPRGEDDAI